MTPARILASLAAELLGGCGSRVNGILDTITINSIGPGTKIFNFCGPHASYLGVTPQDILLIELGVRAERQALTKWGLNHVIDESLPRKLERLGASPRRARAYRRFAVPTGATIRAPFLTGRLLNVLNVEPLPRSIARFFSASLRTTMRPRPPFRPSFRCLDMIIT